MTGNTDSIRMEEITVDYDETAYPPFESQFIRNIEEFIQISRESASIMEETPIVIELIRDYENLIDPAVIS
jgi:hypothetical protein